ncbi:MAG: iron-containing alcohol dehydrogenase [Spirochaetales bacterium]|nr:iron-containing alcohol dehydrogenase [Spirochaetales bacterium]
MQVFDFFIPSHLKFGIDSLNRAGNIVSSVGNKVFLVTETALLGGEIISHIQNLLAGRKCEVILYDIDIKTFAASSIIDKGAVLARVSYCDVVVGVGGLRALSAAKAIAMLVTNTKSVNDYIDGEMIKEPSIPYIEIPTEARNPFMFNNTFLITDERTRELHILKAANGQPCNVIYDPAVMSDLALPQIMTNVLANAIEGYLSTDSSFLSDMMFLKAIEILSKYLMSAVKDKNSDAVSFLSLSGLMTSMGLSMASTGIIGAVSEVVNQKLRLENSGVASMLLPYVIEFCIPSSVEKLTRVAAAMGISVESMTMLDVAVKVIEHVKKMAEDLELPTKLSDFPLKADDLIDIGDRAKKLDMMNYLPRACSSEELYAILQSAF